MDLSRSVCLITGGSSGLGAAMPMLMGLPQGCRPR
jgi:hypothetical protein